MRVYYGFKAVSICLYIETVVEIDAVVKSLYVGMNIDYYTHDFNRSIIFNPAWKWFLKFMELEKTQKNTNKNLNF